MSIRVPFILAALAVGLFVSCGGLTQAGGTSFLVPEWREIELGAEVHATVVAEHPIRSDDVLTAYVTALGQQLVQVSLRPHLEHRFFVLDTEVINAFAAPGGYVYVTVGLLRQLRSRAELAGVLGHEIGHVSGLHGVREIEDALAVSLLTEWLGGEEEAAAAVLSTIVNIYKNTAHSRDLELEADDLGVDFAHDAGYNPWGLVDFFTLLQEIQGSTDPISKTISDLISSHPSEDERIELSSAKIDALGITADQAGLVIDGADATFMAWADLLARLPPVPADP